MGQTRQDVVNAFNKHVETRNATGLETVWTQAFKYTYPLRGQRFQSNDLDGSAVQSGAKTDNATMYDTTGKDAARLLASSLMSGLTPANSQWLGMCPPSYGLDEDDKDFREWLDICSHIIHKKVHSSNYDSEGFDFFLGNTVGGMCGLYVDAREGNYHFEYWPLETLYVSDTLGRGRIDTVYRPMMLTVPQIVEMFGDAALSEQMMDLKNDPANKKTFKIIHTIRPRMRNKKQTSGIMKKTQPYESLYVCAKSGTLLKEDGFHEFPITVPRWNKVPGTDYAVGPVDDALPDIKTMNKLSELRLMQADLAASGMYVAKNDGVINPHTVRIGARRIIMAGDVNNIKAIGPAGDFNITSVEMDRIASNIRRVLMSDQLQPQNNGPAMTATEVYVRVNLIRQLLGPLYGRFQAEFLQPMIERLFGLAMREGWIPKAPDFEGKTWIPQYLSPLARAQKQEDVQAIVQYEASLAQTAQINPTALDFYDTDKAATLKASLHGVPGILIRSSDDVKKLRKQRADQQQAEAAAEAESELAQTG